MACPSVAPCAGRPARKGRRQAAKRDPDICQGSRNCLVARRRPTTYCRPKPSVCEIYGQRDRGLGAVGRYNLLADCYRAAAQEIGEVPSKVQAVTWVAHIERAR
ncbi:DUF7178 family protein [Streptomyces levis]|uniref:DUF7178 family protein n=1 Tax=Streptomyces levis TaxID=285566 RepID=UPI003CD06EC7